MPLDTSLAPLRGDQFGPVQAQHLLNRAGFGGTPAQVRALVDMRLQAAVDLLVDYQQSPDDVPPPSVDADIIRPPTTEERAIALRARRDNDQAMQEQLRAERVRRENQDRAQMRELECWWLQRMISTSRPLEEKLVLLWHGHFATGFRSVRDSYLMYQQQQMFRQHAGGSFAELARGIIRDPAMIVYLNNNTNRRERPNENLARELMELFTLGEGQYAEEDIKAGARALTGYTYADNDFVFNRRQHDPAVKTIFGASGRFDGDAFVDMILARPACARFVAYKLYRHFVADLAQPADADSQQRQVIDQLAAQLWDSGYQIAPVLRTLFASRHFHDPAIVANMIKSPAQLVAGTVRMLNTPTRDLGTLVQTMALMGQRLFEPPTVAGWDGGRSWINSSTLFARQNICVYLLTGRQPGRGGRGGSVEDYDAGILVADAVDAAPATVVDRLMNTLLAGQDLPHRRAELLALAGTRIDRRNLLEMLLFITAMPEYQLC